MEVGYARPVNYLFNNSMHSDFMTEPVNIKMEAPDLCEYVNPTYYPYPTPKLNDFKISAIKHKTVSVMSEPEPHQLTSWTTTHPQHWTKKEVLDWIFYVVEQEHLDGSKLQGEVYRNFTGDQLCKMDRKQFQEMDPYYGIKMYEMFRSLINNISFEEPTHGPDPACLEFFNHINSNEYNSLNKSINDGVTGRNQTNSNITRSRSDSILNNSGRNNNGLVVYQTDEDEDMKVHLPCLGDYPISPDIDLAPSSSASSSASSSSSALSPRLSAGASFTSPPMPLSPHQLAEFSELSSTLSTSSLSCSSITSVVPMSSSTKPRSYSSSSVTSSYAHVFPQAALPPGRMTSRCHHLSSSSSPVSSASILRQYQPSVALSPSFSLPMPSSSLSSSSTSSSPPPVKDERIDPEYGSDDSTPGSFMPPFPPGTHMYAPCPITDDVDINDRPLHRPTSYSNDVMADCVMEEKKKVDKKHKNPATKSGNHLWEFVRDLLRDPKTNPKLLKWEDKESGVFRFVQSEKVAQLWGEKKNNPLMTYEKLSRAMRFCRSAGYFDNVPKNGKFPKKLCFMFGEKAQGWRD